MDAFSSDELDRGFIEWINSFDNLSRSAESFTELSDGVLLFEIMNQIDSQIFQTVAIKTETDGNWVLKESNLKKLKKLLSRWYDEHLSQNVDDISPIDVGLIAKDNDSIELIKLVQLVLGAVVSCDNNAEYIGRMGTLASQTQAVLKVATEDIMGKFSEFDIRGRALSFESNSPERLDVLKLTEEKDRLAAELIQLQEQLKDLSKDYTAVVEDREEVLKKLRDFEDQLSKKDQASKQDFKLRAELESLRAELFKVDGKRQEAEQAVEKQTLLITELTRKVESLTKQADEASKLRDQLDELKHVTDKLAKAEAAAEKYKQKAEEASELRRQIKALQAEREESLSKQSELEEVFHKNTAKQSVIDTYKDQVLALSSKNQELLTSQTKAEFELKKLRDQVAGLEAEKTRHQEQIDVLQDRIKDMETNVHSTHGLEEGQGGIGSELSDKALSDLKSEVARLKRENRLLQQSHNEGDHEGLLAKFMETAKQEKDMLQQKFKEEYEKNLNLTDTVTSLETRLKELETKAMSASVKASDDTVRSAQLAERDRDLKATRSKLSEAEREIGDLQRKLDASQSALADLQKEVITAKSELSLVGLDKIGMAQELEREYAQRLNDQTKEIVEAKAAVESQLAQLQQIHSQVTSELASLQSENLQLKNSLQEQLVKVTALQESVNALQSEKLEMLENRAIQVAKTSGGEASSEMLDILKQRLELETRKIADLESKITELKDERATLQATMKKLKNLFASQQEKLKQTEEELTKAKASFGKGGNYEEAHRLLKQDIAAREAENIKLKEALESLHNTARQEQRLMAAAWYNMSMQLQRKQNNSNARPARASWLSKRRLELEQTTMRPGATSL